MSMWQGVRLIVADIAVNSAVDRGRYCREQFRIVTDYKQNGVDFFRQMSCIAIPEPNIGDGTSGECSLVDLIGVFVLVDICRADYNGRTMWTWILKWPSTQVDS